MDPIKIPNKTSEAQIRASRSWDHKNPIKAQKVRLKSAARVFLREYATQEEYEELLRIYENRKDK